MQKYIEYVLLAAILVIVSYGVFAGGESKFGSTTDKITNLTALSLSEDLVVSGLTTLTGTTSAGVMSPTSLSVSGASTLSGTNTLSGATTLSGTAKVQASASSTIIVGGAGTGGGYTAGCIKLGDSGNATATPVYITATGATITATTTRPSTCSSQ